MKIALIRLPLYVHTTKSKTTKGKVIFNLNNYRNMFHTKSNNAKKEMKKYVKSLNITPLGTGPFLFKYTYFHGNKRKLDLSNPCSIIDKFTCDALVELQIIPEDNIDFIKKVEYEWGGEDPNKKGYCILEIYKI